MQFPDCITKHFSFHSPMNNSITNTFHSETGMTMEGAVQHSNLISHLRQQVLPNRLLLLLFATASASASAAPMSGVSQILQPPTGPTGPFKDWPGFDPSKQPTTTAPAAIVSSAVAVSQ